MNIICDDSCETPTRKVERYDHFHHAVPPNDMSDLLILASGPIKEQADMFLQRAYRKDMWVMYGSIIILNVLFLIISIIGINSTWYKNLQKSAHNSFVLGIIWVIVAIMSYGAIFMLWKHIEPDEVSEDLKISALFLSGTFLSLLWVVVFFQGNNITMAVWIGVVLFLYYFWLLIYMWSTKASAAIFMLPLVILYGYFVYSMIHLASLNNVMI